MKTPIEFFIEYLKLGMIDDNYFLSQRPAIQKDFIELIKKYEIEYYNSLENKNGTNTRI